MKTIGSDTSIYLLSGILFCLCAALAAVLVVFHKKLRTWEQNAARDAVTGGQNQISFVHTAEKLIAERPNQYTFVAMELKNHTQIRHTFGILESNRVLVHLQNVLAKSLGKFEPSAHIDGGIFCFLIRNLSPGEIETRLTRILENANAFNQTRIAPFMLELCFGICLPQQTAIPLSQMRDHAFAMLPYADTHARYRFYDSPTETETLAYKQELVRSLEHSLQANDFVVYMQPKVRLSDSRIVGTEALIRWRHPVRGMMMPDEFLPILDEYHMTHLIDRFLFEAVCKKLSAWVHSGKKPCPVSVNFSRVSANDPNFAEIYVQICNMHALDPSLFEFELSEAFLTESPQFLKEIIATLHSHGFRCSLDNFGKRRLPLHLLHDSALDALKLDSSLFTAQNNTRTNRFTIEAILKLTSQMQITTVAEGIDNASQLQYLKHIGCDLVQGFYFFRPMPIDEFPHVAYYEDDLRFLEEEENKAQSFSASAQQLNENVVLFSLLTTENRITFSNALSPLFGQNLSFDNAIARLTHSQLIHENDRHDFLHMLERAEKESGWVFNTLRFYTAQDHYEWLEVRIHREHVPDSAETVFSGALINVSGWKNAVDQWKEKATRDALTGLYNREHFEQAVAQSLQEETLFSAAIIFIDIDDFKRVNDTLGHTTGDNVIHWVAKRILGVFRYSDIVARYGGDEFVVFAKGITRNNLQERLMQLCETFHFPYRNDTLEYNISGSIGAAMFPEDGTDYLTLLEHADNALYAAKQQGKKRFVFYEPGMENTETEDDT